MIKSLQQLAFKLLKFNMFMIVSSLLCITLSISLVVTMINMSNQAHQGMINDIKALVGEVDLFVGYQSSTGKSMDEALTAQVLQHEGVAAFSKVLLTRTLVNDEEALAYTVGVEQDDIAKSRYHFTAPIAEDEVIISSLFADAFNLALGDTVRIQGGVYSIVEIIESLSGSGTTPLMAILPHQVVQKLMYEESGVWSDASYLLINMKEGFNVDAVAEAARSLDPILSVEVVMEQELITENLQALTVFLVVLSILVVIIAGMIFIANFEMYLYKNNHQLAVLRSFGARTGQLFRLLLLQCSLLNVVGGTFAFFLSWGSFQFIKPYMLKLLDQTSSTGQFSIGLSIVITLICMAAIQLFLLFPAYRGSKILPIQLMQQSEELNFKMKRSKMMAGFIMLALGILLSVIGTYIISSPLMILLAALITISALYLLFPLYYPAILSRVIVLLKPVLGRNAFISLKHFIPQVRRNTFVVLIISTLMMITVFGSALLYTVNENGNAYTKSQYPTEIVLRSNLSYETKLDAKLVSDTAREVLGEDVASVISIGDSFEVMEKEHRTSVNYVLADLSAMAKQGMLPNVSYSEDSVILTKQMAEALHVEVGDQVPLSQFDFDLQQYQFVMNVTVSSVVDSLFQNIDAYLDNSNSKLHNENMKFSRMFVSGELTDQMESNLTVITDRFPELKIGSVQEELAYGEKHFLQRWIVFIIVMLVILLGIMMSVFQTLINNISSKRKEIAVLRTISLKRNGVVSFVMTQVLTYVISGILFGIVSGIVLTKIMSLVDSESSWTIDLSLPVLLPFLLLTCACIIFIPYAYRLGGKGLLLELNQDNK